MNGSRRTSGSLGGVMHLALQQAQVTGRKTPRKLRGFWEPNRYKAAPFKPMIPDMVKP